jgi:hypothetical protein
LFKEYTLNPMIKTRYQTFITSITSVGNIGSSDLCAQDKIHAPFFSAGISTFSGLTDVNSHLFGGSNFRIGYHVKFELRINDWFGAGLTGSFGKLYGQDCTIGLNRNFQTNLLNGSLYGAIYFANDQWMSRKAPLQPYLSIGFSYFQFDPYSDLPDKNNSIYHYWSDETIRDKDEASGNFLTPQLTRDYVNETRLTDSSDNYARYSFAVPLIIGGRFAITGSFGAEVYFTCNIAFTDRIDHYTSGGNDSWMNFGFGLYYKADKQKEKQRAKEEELWRELEEQAKREEQEKDKATKTDSTATNCMTAEFVSVDYKKDCKITAVEINRGIDSFFDGETDWTVDKINRLIDYFFEQ